MFTFTTCAVVAFAACAISSAHAQSARQLEKQGREAFENDSFEEAANAFDKAATAAAEGKLDAAVAQYNRSLALARLGRHQDAAEGYVESLRTTDLALQQTAYYNRGNALMAAAGDRETQGALQPAIEVAHEALAMYEKSITLDPHDASAKTNFELALRKIEELESKLDQQQQNEENEQDDQSPDQQDEPSEQNDESEDSPEDQQNQDQDGQQDEQQDRQQDGQPEDPSEDDRPPPEQRENSSQPRPSEEMTREEAEMLLDAIREEEQSAREQIRIKFGASGPVEKDW